MPAELQVEAAWTSIHEPAAATVFVALDDADAALDWLERCYRESHPLLRFVGGNQGFDRLRPDPRFIDLMRQVGLPPAGLRAGDSGYSHPGSSAGIVMGAPAGRLKRMTRSTTGSALTTTARWTSSAASE